LRRWRREFDGGLDHEGAKRREDAKREDHEDPRAEIQLFGVEIRYSSLKEKAAAECYQVWTAMNVIYDALKQRLPNFAEMWRGE
jgi:hypothetical protein